MRIEDMITQDESNWCFNKFSPLLLLKTHRDNKWEFEFWCYGLTNGSIHFRMTHASWKALLSRWINRKLLSWDRENYIFPIVTKMGSIFGHRIDYNGAGALRGQRHVHNQQKLTQVDPAPDQFGALIPRVWKGIFGIPDLTKIRCKIRENAIP